MTELLMQRLADIAEEEDMRVHNNLQDDQLMMVNEQDLIASNMLN